MQLQEIDKAQLRGWLVRNGTRPARVDEIMLAIGRHKLRGYYDGTMTVLVAGDRIGVAKRAESGPKRDRPSEVVGWSVAASRL